MPPTLAIDLSYWSSSIGVKYCGYKLDEKHDFQKLKSSYVGVFGACKATMTLEINTFPQLPQSYNKSHR